MYTRKNPKGCGSSNNSPFPQDPPLNVISKHCIWTNLSFTFFCWGYSLKPPTGLHGVCKEDTLNSGSNCRTYYVNPQANYETNIFILSSIRNARGILICLYKYKRTLYTSIHFEWKVAVSAVVLLSTIAARTVS